MDRVFLGLAHFQYKEQPSQRRGATTTEAKDNLGNEQGHHHRGLFFLCSTADGNAFIGDIKDKVSAWKQYRKAAISGENAGLVR